MLVCAAAFEPVQAQVPGTGPFGVYRELWPGLDPSLGDTLDALTNTLYNPNWPDNPDPNYTQVYTNFEAGVNTGMYYYGQRMRAFVVPPLSGSCVFWIASDDTSELFLSSDETPSNKAPIAWVNTWTSSREWTKEPNQQSGPLPLEAGRRYYIEAIMQQGGGGDNLAVRWRLPDGTIEEPIPAVGSTGTRLIPFDGGDTLPSIYQQTANPTVVEGNNARLSVLAINHAPVTYRWLLQGTNLPGASATKPFYALTNIPMSYNGLAYSCAVSNAAGTTISATMVLTVLRDTNPPAVVRVVNVGSTNVVVVYSKVVEQASAVNPLDYTFTNGLRVTSATLGADNVTVSLKTPPLVYGSNYVLVINKVRDRASLPNTIATNTTVSFVASPYTPMDLGRATLPSTALLVATNALDISAGGGNLGGSADQCNFNYQVRSGDFDIAVLVAGLTLGPLGQGGPDGARHPGPEQPVRGGADHAVHGRLVLRMARPGGQPGQRDGQFSGQFPQRVAAP